MLTESSNFALF